MRVKLTRRLGQNQAGTTLDTTTKQGKWLTDKGYATEVKEAPKTRTAETSTDEPKPKRRTKPDDGGDSE